jgi:UDP-MurNAc hydroxylase
MFKPFSGHIFEESLIGNLIDSALIFENQNKTAINFNDNTPTLKSCEMLAKRFKKIDLAMINYNAAGPYPSCFNNLSYKEKILQNYKILNRNFDYMCEIIKRLKPHSILPFAGSYILGGKFYKKNEYLGTTTWDICADYLREKLDKKYNIICLRENDVFDLSKKISNNAYNRINLKHMKTYIKKIKSKKYDYEKDSMPSYKKLKSDVLKSSENLKVKITNFNVKINSNVYLKLGRSKVKLLNGKDHKRKIICSLDNRLLRRILDRKAHWNNAEIGCHINFERSPDKMDPDVHTAMSFFHL